MKKTSDNGYFIISPDHDKVVVEKAHFCTWNMTNGLEFLEVGMLIQLKEEFLSLIAASRCAPELEFKVFIPWYEGDKSFGDLFESLIERENARFIFNEQIDHMDFIAPSGPIPQGVLVFFIDKPKFCLLQCRLSNDEGIQHTVSAKVEFPRKEDDRLKVGDKIYFRFFVKVNGRSIPWKHGSVAKTSLCYDIKVNEPRNAPTKFPLEQMVELRSCYCLHIVPSTFECSLLDRSTIQSIRPLESDGVSAYTKNISAIRSTVSPGDYLVVFNKLKNNNDTRPFLFFTLFSKERIGPSQLALAIGTNIGCGLLAYWTWKASLVFLVLVILVAVVISPWNRFGARIRSALGLV